ncbi:DUF4249 domain-containing protein [Spirosoma radiotolerans]|uniref:DUF4249 domain-containing protein n=1 Tax=Spirosoma radiotolerans TaxID=1379870 RepID=A0A0E4A1F6_9BACT|nr:DUF4249 domain-containing protein [Spirosoma radiotolerans]AKD58590.1 hypothetical protein SD10_16860 [Spirosoma radiotolerans]
MRLVVFALSSLLLTFLLTACVDPLELTIIETVDILVVDGTITNLPEPQIIRINRSKSDPLTGRFGSVPITKALVEVLVDSAQRLACHETVAGSYQLPSDFRGQVGHAYQLQFTLSDGTHYVSTQQIMQPVPAIGRVSAKFNSASLPVGQQLAGGYRAGHDVFIDWTDPANQHNYYRWEWKLYEKQHWCRSCQQGIYAVNVIPPHAYKDKTFYVSSDELYENCFVPVNYLEAAQPPFYSGSFVYDYPCRTQCWDIIYSSSLNVFDDQYSNGGQILGRNVAQIPYYDSTAALVEIRQLSLPPSAHTYFSRFQNQTQNVNGLTDSSPSAPVGNIHNAGNRAESVVGYFTASAVSAVRYWLDRKDVVGLPFGQTDPTRASTLPGAELFYSLNLRQPIPEPLYPYPPIRVWGGPPRPVTAICVSSDSRTPFKPDGWQD